METMDPFRLIFIDETGVNIGMTRLYGRGLIGERVVDYTPDVRFERLTLLSSVRLDGTTVPLYFEGSLNGAIFLKYVETFLVPELREGDIVIMDNLSSHKVKGIAELIHNKKAQILYLPPYSPDMNPIEEMWSKLKAFLKKIKARTYDELTCALKQAFETITSSDVNGWFCHANYCLQ